MTMTPEQAVYAAAFAQALAVVCNLGAAGSAGGAAYHYPSASDIQQARAWALVAVDAWRTSHKGAE